VCSFPFRLAPRSDSATFPWLDLFLFCLSFSLTFDPCLLPLRTSFPGLCSRLLLVPRSTPCVLFPFSFVRPGNDDSSTPAFSSCLLPLPQVFLKTPAYSLSLTPCFGPSQVQLTASFAGIPLSICRAKFPTTFPSYSCNRVVGL